MNPVLSSQQAAVILEARKNNRQTALVSLDLGLTQSDVHLNSSWVSFPDGQRLDWLSLQSVQQSENGCFLITDHKSQPIQFYSELTDRFYSLCPTTGAPTMLVSGIPMHRLKDTEPHQDTIEKIRSIKPVVGRVLDTATGLGYTAQLAAKTASHVVTIELDPAAIQVARLNPWSQTLFNNPKITQIIGDSFTMVVDFDGNSFSRIIHDPPAFSLAGDLYSTEFYQQLFRVLRNNGRLYHYVGDPHSKSGHNITSGVIRRLKQAGFRQVRSAPKAFGVIADK